MYRRLANSQQFISDIAVEPATGILYVAGSFLYSVQNADYLILKYSSVTGLEDEEDLIINNYILDQNYPNPFNPTTKIRYSIPNVIGSETKQSQIVSLKIFDVLGKQVASLVDKEQPAGSYDVDFNSSGLTSGVYFYKLQAGSYSQTKKMLLLK